MRKIPSRADRDVELAKIEEFARTRGVLMCPSTRDIVTIGEVPLELTRGGAKSWAKLKFRPPFEGVRVRSE